MDWGCGLRRLDSLLLLLLLLVVVGGSILSDRSLLLWLL